MNLKKSYISQKLMSKPLLINIVFKIWLLLSNLLRVHSEVGLWNVAATLTHWTNLLAPKITSGDSNNSIYLYRHIYNIVIVYNTQYAIYVNAKNNKINPRFRATTKYQFARVSFKRHFKQHSRVVPLTVC